MDPSGWAHIGGIHDSALSSLGVCPLGPSLSLHGYAARVDGPDDVAWAQSLPAHPKLATIHADGDVVMWLVNASDLDVGDGPIQRDQALLLLQP